MLTHPLPRHLTAVLLTLLTTAALAQTTQPAAPKQSDPAAIALADKVMKASGSDNWHKVTRIQFTFNVFNEDGSQAMAATHDWDLTKNTDTVTWKDKTVTVDLSTRPANDPDATAAYQRWVNDSYWLLMPLKLRDPGVTLTLAEPNVLRLSFQGVGLTPGDQYNVYINPVTNLPEKWDYMPTPDKKTTGSWEAYQSSGGLTLSTSHTFGPRKITITNLTVTAK